MDWILVFIILVILLIYIPYSLSLYVIAKRTNTSNAIIAWLGFPFNVLLLAGITNQSEWLMLILVIGFTFIPKIGWILSLLLLLFFILENVCCFRKVSFI